MTRGFDPTKKLLCHEDTPGSELDPAIEPPAKEEPMDHSRHKMEQE
jgi:hypothetical protein